MQVNYKTISSVEYDVLSGTYKKVDKEVEDTSSSTSFSNLLSSGASEEQESYNEFSLRAKPTLSAQNFADDFTSNLYALRFRENESQILEAQEAENTQNSVDKNLNNLFSTIS